MVDNTFVPRHHVRTFQTAKKAAALATVLISTVAVYGGGTAEKGAVAAPEPPNVLIEEAQQRLVVVQEALEGYKKEHGTYPSTQDWYLSNVLNPFVQRSYTYDPWRRKFHYKAVKDEKGQIINYHLESLGERDLDSSDDVFAPIEPRLHGFSGEIPLRILFPEHDATIRTESDDSSFNLLAACESDDSVLTWYLDGKEIGKTQENHSLQASLMPGEHHLFIIDQEDNNANSLFNVASRSSQ